MIKGGAPADNLKTWCGQCGRGVTFRATLVIIAAVVPALGIAGCWLPALQFAPLAIGAAQGVGAAVFGMAEGAVVMAHQGAGQEPGEQGEDEMAREDRCEDLEDDVPGVIELRQSASGASEYRELQLEDAHDQPQWAALSGPNSSAGGWHPANHLLQMDFTPPLSNPIPAVGSSYLAYRPAQSDSAIAEDLLVPLSLNFGTTSGTFAADGREYQFALTRTLPCFPAPP